MGVGNYVKQAAAYGNVNVMDRKNIVKYFTGEIDQTDNSDLTENIDKTLIPSTMIPLDGSGKARDMDSDPTGPGGLDHYSPGLGDKIPLDTRDHKPKDPNVLMMEYLE